MTVVRTLTALLGFDVDQKAIDKADKAFDDFKEKARAVATTFAAIGAGISAGVGAAFGLAKSTTDAAIAAENMGLQLGLSAQAVQELEYAAAGANVPVEALHIGLRDLGRSAANALKGEAGPTEALSRLGVRATDANGKLKTTDVLLEDVAGAFGKLGDDGTRAQIAMALFGRSGAQMIPLLVQGKDGIAALRVEAEELGAVIGADTIAASHAFDDALTRVTFGVKGLKNVLGAALIPVFLPYLKMISAWIRANRELIRTKAAEWVETFAGALKQLVRLGIASVRMILQIVDALGGVRRIAMFAGAALGVYLASQIGSAMIAFGKLFALILAGEAGVSLVPLAIGAAILALAALIFLVWEDVNGFLKGEDSLIGQMSDEFMAGPNINDHWLVKAMRLILSLTDEVNKKLEALNQFIGINALGARLLDGPTAQSLPEAVDALQSMPTETTDNFAGGVGGFLSRMVSQQFGGHTITVNVDASGNADPKAVGAATGEAIQSVLDEDRQSMLRGANQSFSTGTGN